MARMDSPFVRQIDFGVVGPLGLVRANEPVTITATVKDSDNATGRSEITFQAAADEINPEVAVTQPGINFAPHESTDFTLGFRGYDNVKVERMEAYVAYGARDAAGNYYKTSYAAPLRKIEGIEAKDFEPITTLNIDTPEYLQLIHVGTVGEITGAVVAEYPAFNTTGDVLCDVWVKVVASDAQGNIRSREISYRVRRR